MSFSAAYGETASAATSASGSSAGTTHGGTHHDDDNERNHVDDSNDASDNHSYEHDKENHRHEIEARRTKEREASMAELKVKFESSLDTIRNAAKKLLTEIGSHVKVTHSVVGEYEDILETQQQEAQRLEDVNQKVLSATNPFLGGGGK